MKKIYTESKWKKQSRRRQRDELTRSRTHFVRLERRDYGGTPVLYPQPRVPQLPKRTVVIKSPHNLSFINNPVEMIMLFDHISSETKKGHNVFIDISEISNFTVDSVVVLLSKANEAKFARGMSINVNEPLDENLKELYRRSGILQYINENTYRLRPGKFQDGSGYVYKKKSYVVEPRTAKDLIKLATTKIYGERQRRKGIQRTLIECMNNTFNHAAPGEIVGETWWATVYCDEKMKKAYFNFIDNGVGIFESIKIRDLKTRAARLLGFKNNADLMREILRGEIGSRTGLSYRGNGLPKIREVAERGQLADLIIISNNVYSNVSKDEYTTIPFSFEGTFFHWEMTNV